MAIEDDILRAVRQKRVDSIVSLMFEGDPPTIKPGFHTETEVWDYKTDCPKLGRKHQNAWAELAKDVLGFYNHRGGVLIFGIRDEDYSFCGATERLDSKLVNDQLRKFLGDRIWIDFHREFIQANQLYIGVALVPQRGPTIQVFKSDAPEVNGRNKFRVGDTAIRKGDSTVIIPAKEVPEFSRSIAVPTIGRVFEIDEPFFRVLAPDYQKFVMRADLCRQIEGAISDPRSSVTSIIGIGGVGKTALATWATLRAYEKKQFSFIVSITAKDRELTSSGIQALNPGLTSYESLLDSVLDVLNFPEIKSEKLQVREKSVRSVLENSNGLLFVDNLETVDDPRIIEFLDNLPVGVRAITTSRRTSVRVSVRPIEVGPLLKDEVVSFISSISSQPGLSYLESLSKKDREKIGDACDGVPVAIRWVLSRSKGSVEAMHNAEAITQANRHGEELLEFCFRRVFETMTNDERAIVQVLSLFQQPVSTEVLLIGSGVPHYKLQDCIEDLRVDAIVQRTFDEERNDYSYALIPITRTFVYSDVASHTELELKIRKRLNEYFEARDIRNLEERLVVREVRQGKGGADSALVDLAVAAQRRGDIQTSESLYGEALKRNPNSWKAARLYAEFHRHVLQNPAEALRLYERAAANAPSRGEWRSKIFREWGILLRGSGDPDAAEQAIDKLEIALEDSPHDVVAVVALAQLMDRQGASRRVVDLLEPLQHHHNQVTREKALPLLLRAYERLNEMVKASQVRSQLDELGLGFFGQTS